ncbi:hypothetical protein ACLQ85_01375 [Gallibacterium anatis]|uniref:hypothetical protein n=3 Tax=Gallibacterium anatis TaxID=750 RepID=UPI0039FD8E0B
MNYSLEKIKEYIILVEHFLVIFLPIVVLFNIIFVWGYLAGIKAVNLFVNVLSFSGMPILLFLAFLYFMIILVLLITICRLYYIRGVFLQGDYKYIALILCSIELLLLNLPFYLIGNSVGNYYIFIPYVVVILINVILAFKISKCKVKTKNNVGDKKIDLPSFLFFSCLFLAFFPTSILFLYYGNVDKVSDFVVYASYGIYSILIFLLYLFIIFCSRERKFLNYKRDWIFLGVIVIFLSLFFVMFIPYFKLSDSVMVMLGIRDAKEKCYYIDSKFFEKNDVGERLTLFNTCENKNSYKGKVLWRVGDVYVFQISNKNDVSEENKDDNFIYQIEKEYIHLIQK